MAPRDKAAQGTPGGGDRLSGLRDGTLLRVMSHFEAREAVRLCALSKRWRDLWTSLGHLDIREPCFCHTHDEEREEEFHAFVKHLLLRRRPLVPLASLRLCWTHETDDGDTDTWITHAVRRGAEEIELSAEHHNEYPTPEYMSFIIAGEDYVQTCLRILKLTHIRLDDTTLTQISSRCTCLEELELKDCQIPDATWIRTTKLKRLTMIKCQIRKGCLVYAPNLVSLCCSRPAGYVPWIENLGSPGVVNIIFPQTPDEYPEYTDLVSCNLKVLKLSHVHLDDTTLRQLCSRCTSLEELELQDCSVEGNQIGSTSLKYLAMIRCKFSIGFRVHAPNLVFLRCIKPFQYYPWMICEMEFLATAAIVLDDSCFLSDCQWPQKEDESDDNCNSESDGDSGDSKHNNSDGSSIYYDSDRSAPSDEEDDDCTLSYTVIAEEKYKVSNYLISGHKRSANKPVKSACGEYGSMVSSNVGGVGMLRSLSHVKTTDLLAHPGEVLLTRELKSCTHFKNLKTLSLGEWCITRGFDVLASILGHSPNLEKLFLHLDMAYNSRVGFTAITGSFLCTKLKMVRITCCKRDVMVHRLAEFFIENSIPREMIFVCRTACSGCQGSHRLQGKGKAQSAAEMREAKRMKTGN